MSDELFTLFQIVLLGKPGCFCAAAGEDHGDDRRVLRNDLLRFLNQRVVRVNVEARLLFDHRVTVTAGTNGDRELIGTRELDRACNVDCCTAAHDHSGASRIEHPIPKSTGELVALFAWVDNFAEQTRLEIF
jgi:hypothetical protein